MTDADLTDFQTAVQEVRLIFPLRGDPEEFDRICRAYFTALRSYPLSAVRAGVAVGMRRWTRFPRPAEWIDAIPRRGAPSTVAFMTDTQAHEWNRAESLRWEDVPCACAECFRAGVSQPIRFVPELEEDGRDRRVKHPRTDRVVTAGHWAHGDELAGYYLARAQFFGAFLRVVRRHTMTREPGEEG